MRNIPDCIGRKDVLEWALELKLKQANPELEWAYSWLEPTYLGLLNGPDRAERKTASIESQSGLQDFQPGLGANQTANH